MAIFPIDIGKGAVQHIQAGIVEQLLLKDAHGLVKGEKGVSPVGFFLLVQVGDTALIGGE